MNFPKTLLLLTFLFILVVSTGGEIQQIEIFSESNQTGDSITLRSKYPDLKNWKNFLSSAKSYCVSGYWHFFSNVNYTGDYKEFIGAGGWPAAWEHKKCGNYSNFDALNSARYGGPLDTSTVGITIYEGSDGFQGYGGIEVVVEGRAATNFPISDNMSQYVTSHGRSNWTYFTEENFQGNSWCFRPRDNWLLNFVAHPSSAKVRSVIRGCDELNKEIHAVK